MIEFLNSIWFERIAFFTLGLGVIPVWGASRALGDRIRWKIYQNAGDRCPVCKRWLILRLPFGLVRGKWDIALSYWAHILTHPRCAECFNEYADALGTKYPDRFPVTNWPQKPLKNPPPMRLTLRDDIS